MNGVRVEQVERDGDEDGDVGGRANDQDQRVLQTERCFSSHSATLSILLVIILPLPERCFQVAMEFVALRSKL